MPSGLNDVPNAQRSCLLGVSAGITAAGSRRAAGRCASALGPESVGCSLRSAEKGLPLLMAQLLTTARPGWVLTARAWAWLYSRATLKGKVPEYQREVSINSVMSLDMEERGFLGTEVLGGVVKGQLETKWN